jgi:hypothetical protein
VKRFFSVSAWFGSLLTFIVALLAPASAFAYSGSGIGSETNPYRISNCAQLQETNNDLSGYYILVSDIDCTGISFVPIGSLNGDFTGHFDGRNHTILNLNHSDGSDTSGLFGSVNHSTIENINLLGGVIETNVVYSGGIVGFAQNSTLSNLHSNQTIHSSSYGYLGGIVGILYQDVTVNKSSFTGNLSGIDTDSYIGGISGIIYDSASSISDSYSSGSISPPTGGSDVGGIVGANFGGGAIRRVYSEMIFTAQGLSQIGGLVGLDLMNSGILVDSFSAATITGEGTDVGAVIGGKYNTTPLSNDYFDQYVGPANCVGSDFNIISPECSQENTDNNYPLFFKNNSINGPFSAWDFNEIWQVTSGYPTLRDSNLLDAPSYPNSGDANADGIQDSYQGNVANIVDRNGIWSTVSVPAASGCTIGNAASNENDPSHVDTGFGAITSLDAFSIYCPSASTTVKVSIIYDKVYSAATLRFFNTATHSYSAINGVVYSTVTINGVNKTVVTYDVTDGSALDIDGIANGIFVDPVQLTNAITPPNTGAGNNNSIEPNVIGLSISATALLAIAYVLRKIVKD